MNGVILFGIGSPLVVEYEETCRRRGVPIVAAVKNHAGPAYFRGAGPIVDLPGLRALAPAVASVPCLCPIFTPGNRRLACEAAAAAGFRFAPALIDPSAIVASSCTVGEGSFVNAGCVVGAWTHVAEHVVVNRGASIGHDVRIERFASLGPSAVVCGNVTIESGALIGAGAVILPSVRIGADAVVGAGAVVVGDVPANAKALGNPARIGTGAAPTA